jgi:hypothetical protein
VVREDARPVEGGSLTAAVKEDGVDAVGGDIFCLARFGVSVKDQVGVAGFGKGDIVG